MQSGSRMDHLSSNIDVEPMKLFYRMDLVNVHRQNVSFPCYVYKPYFDVTKKQSINLFAVTNTPLEFRYCKRCMQNTGKVVIACHHVSGIILRKLKRYAQRYRHI